MMMMNNFGFYDDKIKEIKTDFRTVVKSILGKFFEVKLEDTEISRIYVDLNSALSIVFRYEDLDDDELLEITRDAIENFLMNSFKLGITVNMLFTTTPSKVHTTIYPDWCKKRNSRVDILKSEYLKKLLATLKIFSDKNPHLKIINIRDFHPALVIMYLDKPFIKGSLMMSRDGVFRCFMKGSLKLYNGVEWIDFSMSTISLPEGIVLTDPFGSLAYYYTLRGESRNEYKGCEGYGVVKAVQYVEANRLRFIANIEHKEKEFIDKHLALYDINKMKEKAEELKLDYTIFDKYIK